MCGHHVLLFEEAVKAGDGSGKSSLAELATEDHKTGMRIEATHIGD